MNPNAAPHPDRSSGVAARLRAETAADHDAVDAAYAGYDLGERESYARFLYAHARALPAVEAALAGRAPFRERATLIAADLADLGIEHPALLDFDAPDGAAATWGMLYVIEGSRLGGTMLARRVGEGLPSRYLAARHESGEWRRLLAGMDAAAVDAAWVDQAVVAARATFALYGRAVG